MRTRLFSIALAASTLLSLGACLSSKDAVEDTATPEDTGEDTDPVVEAPDAGDSRDEAMAVEFDQDEGYFAVDDGLINPAGDRDFYAFQGVAGQGYGFWAQSYYFYEEVLTDTVLRIWDETGTEPLFTNDDMPFRMWETDSAIFFEPTVDGTYYVEILDWSDWLDDEYAAEGGSDKEYALMGFLMDSTEVEPNDTPEDVESWWVDADDDGSKDVGVFAGSFADGYASFHGNMEFSGDNDLFPLEFDDDGAASWCQFGTWPDSSNMQAEFTLYNEYMEPVAQSTDTDVKPQWFGFYDAGITYRIPEEGGVFYLGVADVDENQGAGTFYSGMNVCWTYNADPDNPGATLEPFEEETNDSAGEPNELGFNESDNTENYYYAWLYGNLEEQDPGDWLWVKDSDVGDSLEGKYLNVHIASATLGSLLDPEVTVYSFDPTNGTTAELATAVAAEAGADHDYEVVDLLLGDESQLVIEISGDSAPIDEANNWIALVTVYDEPSTEE